MARGTEWGEPGQPVEGGEEPEGRERGRKDREEERGQERGRRGHDPADDDTQPILPPRGVHRE